MRHILFSLALLLAPITAQAQQADLPDDKFFPEGIAAGPDGTMFVGSFYRGGIWHRTPGASEFTPFVTGGSTGLVSVIGLNVDARRGLLFACSSDLGLGALAGHRPADEPAALHAFDLKTGAARSRWPLPPGSFCNDIDFQADGGVLVTNSLLPIVHRLDPGLKVLTTWIEDDRWKGEGFGLNGIAIKGDDTYVVTYGAGDLYRINGDKKVHQVALPRKLGLPDGLKVLPSGELLVVEGTGSLSRITLDGDAARVTVLREGLNQPTTAAIVKDGVWVLEGQLMLLADPSRKGEQPVLPFGAKWVKMP